MAAIGQFVAIRSTEGGSAASKPLCSEPWPSESHLSSLESRCKVANSRCGIDHLKGAPVTSRIAYRDLYFGMSDSYNEVDNERDVFMRSYVDLEGIAVGVVRGEKFLVLGPKGAGKSALACYLRESTGDAFMAEVCDASLLPLAEIPHLQTGQPPGPERTVTAWRFILLTNYLQLLLSDQSCSLNSDPEVVRVARLLRDFGFMSDSQGRALTKLAKTTVKIPIPGLGDLYSRESAKELSIYNLLPYLLDWVASARAQRRHVLLIDGLDSVFLNDSHYDASLSSMVQAAYSINQSLRRASASGSVVLLMRNDIYSRISLSLPDSQKMRDDLAFELDWRILAGPGGVRAPLMKLVNAKAARAANGGDIDVLGYFPAHVEVGKRKRKLELFPYILNFTRHTPRDILRVFEEVRKIDKRIGGGDHPLSQEVIREGILQYSTKYFVGAISNEFAGFHGGPEAGIHAIETLKRLKGQSFRRADFEVARNLVESKSPVPTEQLLRLLFFAGAIGNVFDSGGQRYMQFYHRRDDADVYTAGAMHLHSALIHAWNTPRQPSTLASELQAESGPAASTNERSRRRTRRGKPDPSTDEASRGT